MHSNKRKFRRLPIRGFMKCSVTFMHSDREHSSVSVLSLSAGGMFIAMNSESGTVFRKGDSIDRIRFDLADLQQLQVGIKGKVVHSMSLGEIGGCGVEFEDPPEEVSTELNHFVERKLKDFGLWDMC